MKLLVAIAVSLSISLFTGRAYAGNLSCEVTESCTNGTVLFKLSDTANAHAELPGQSNYAKLVCCSGITGLSNSCSGTYATVLRLADVSNAHVEQNTQSNYPTSVCMQVPSGGTVTVNYQDGGCSGYDTTVGSISSQTNAHIGNKDAYTSKICATAEGAYGDTISFSISDNTVGFGTLSALDVRYANSDSTGSNSEVIAHTISVSTSAYYGYSMYVQGSTLTCAENPDDTIASLGDPGAQPQPGIEQFGIRASSSGGDGYVTSPYDQLTNYAYNATGNAPDQIAGDNNGDDVATTFSIRYVADIAGMTDPGSYSTELTYIVISNF